MGNFKIVAMRGVNAVVAVGTVVLVFSGVAGGIQDSDEMAVVAAGGLLAALYVLCVALNYVFFGKATLWNRVPAGQA